MILWRKGIFIFECIKGGITFFVDDTFLKRNTPAIALSMQSEPLPDMNYSITPGKR